MFLINQSNSAALLPGDGCKNVRRPHCLISVRLTQSLRPRKDAALIGSEGQLLCLHIIKSYSLANYEKYNILNSGKVQQKVN